MWRGVRRHFVFPSALFGPDIIAQSEKDRGAQARLLSPADETHVCDQLGLGPAGLLVGFGDFVERALVDSELLEEVLDVRLDGVDRQIQLVGDLSCGEVRWQVPQDAAFAFGERLG